MRFEILTLFPETFNGFLNTSLIGVARSKGLIRIHLHNIRDWGEGRHRIVDDRPYGGAPGMVLKAEPIYQTLNFVKTNCLGKQKTLSFALSPRGQPLTNSLVKQLSQASQIILLCGHYEGIDERVLSFLDGELSIGDYVTMGGEVASMVVMEAVSRYIPGVLGKANSVQTESFNIEGGLLEGPSYTRPSRWRGKKVPPVLLGGNPKKIKAWHNLQSKKITKKNRSELLGII